MKTTIKWLGEQSYVGIDSHGLEVKINPKPQENEMLKPPDLLLMSLGSCTGLFFTPAVKELGLHVDHFEIELVGEKAKNPPKLFASIHIHLTIWGTATESQIEAAIEKSHERCFILHSLDPGIKVNTTFELQS